MRQLIVNADDFGENPWVNAAIVLAHRAGIVTSTSLMVTEDAFEQAVALAHANPRLRVGLHVVLLHGRACLPPASIPALVDAHGRFPTNPVVAGLRWFFQAEAHEQIRREVSAQVVRFLNAGLPLDHLDSHYHFHVHPVIFDALVDVAEEIGVPHIRLPVERWALSLRLDRSALPRKLAYVVEFSLLARRHRRCLQERGFPSIDGVFGLLQTGNLHERYVIGLLQHLPPGTYELYAHPRLDTAAGIRELRVLLSPRVRQVIRERSIRLTTYSELGG